jgi:heterodisulfide reductase subunit C
MQILQQIIFLSALITAAYLISSRIRILKKTIQLGKPLDRTDQPSQRLQTMLRIAFGQKKMFDRPIVGFMHFVIYAGFIIINIEVLEIVLDGIFGTHRLFAPFLGSFYSFLINFFEILAFGVLIVCIVFLIRRNITKVDRLQAKRHRELNGFPVIDANTILVFEILLMAAFLKMNAMDSVLQDRATPHYYQVGSFVISSFLKPTMALFSTESLIIFERIAWWFHILGIFAFALYVTYSKHLHIFLAFPNTYFADLGSKGKISNMPEVTKEVNLMLGINPPENESIAPTTDQPSRFGAKDIMDLSWKNLMDAYSCTECGRCTSACPANQTGKELSPRKIMMETRDRLEEVGKNMKANKGIFVDDGKSLYKDYISAEELRACTTCNACVQECPILISPMDIILQLRRYQIMEESDAPASWNAMFSNIENNQAPWKFAASDRFNWAENAK